MLREALEAWSENSEDMFNLGESLAVLGVGEYALGVYRATVAADPDHVRALVGIGNLELEFGRFAESLEAFELALTILPDLGEQAALHRSMGEAAIELGHADAAEYFERALAIDALDYNSLDRLAMLRFNQERYEESMSLYETMLELEPGSHAVLTNLGLTQYRLDRFAEARERIAQALEIDPEYELARSVLALIDEEASAPAPDDRN